MLQAIAEHFGHLFGPLRLFGSYLFLAGFVGGVCLVLTFWILPRYWHLLPRDQGRAFAVGAEASVGKPMGAGILFIPVFAATMLLAVPPSWPHLTVITCMLLSMLVGFFDDRKLGGFSEYTLGAFDLFISIVAAGAVCGWLPFEIWLPFIKAPVTVAPWLFVPAMAPPSPAP